MLSSLPATFMRGGTSKAVVFLAEDLPSDQAAWAPIFLAVMGSPDEYRRQLDGMGGGISSLSKICVVARSTRPEADVDYTFAQVSVDEPVVDYSGNCGNMSAAIGPFAVEQRLVEAPQDGEATVRIYNTNTGKLIVSRFGVKAGKIETSGNLRLDGVSGSGAPIRLDFLDPAGSKTGRLLPTGRSRDRMEIEGFGGIEATLVDAANPCVFVEAHDLGCDGSEMPETIERNEQLMSRLESIRHSASIRMGVARTVDEARAIASVPKVALVAPPRDYISLSKEDVRLTDYDIAVRMISIGKPHRAVPLTGAICLAVAMRIPDSLPFKLARRGGQRLRIGHPSGIVSVDADVALGPDGRPHARYGSVYRTARRLFDGHVFYRSN